MRQRRRSNLMNLDRRQITSLLVIPFILILIAVLVLLDDKTVFEPPFVLAILNTIFLGFIPLFIASVAYQSYRKNSAIGILLLGAGMLVFGLGSISAGWLNGLPGGSNITPTIHNTSVCIGSIFSLAAVLLVLSGPLPSVRKERSSVPFFLYGGIVVFVALFSFAAVRGLIPSFFIQGVGPTAIREVILSNATELYALASLLFLLLYRRKRDVFFFWFSLALGLFAIGLMAVFIQPAVGSFIGWTGRISQYIGACFAFVAFAAAKQSASEEGISLPDQINQFFGGEETTHAILSAAKESIWLFGLDNTILMANPTALERLGGRTAGEVIGHNFSEFMTTEIAQTRREKLAEVIRTHQSLRFEDERAGITFDHNFYPVFDKSGSVTRIAVFSRDITKQKQAEEVIRRSEEQYRTLFNAMLEGFCIIDMIFDKENRPVDYRFLEINPAFEMQTGLHDAQGKLMRDLAQDHEAYWFEIYGKIAVTGKPARFENEAKSLKRWFEVIAYKVGGVESRKVAILFNDITDRKLSEEVLRRKQAEIQALFDNTPAGLVLFDASPPYTVLVHNRYYQELFAEPFRNHGMVGLNLYDYAPAVEASGVVAVFDEVVRTRQPKHFLDFPYGSNPPKESWFNWHMSPIIIEGKVVALVSMSIDVTDRHLVEAALRESEDRFRTLADNIPQLCWMANTDGWIFWYNKRWYEYTGTTPESMEGWGWQSVHDPKTLPQVLERWRNSIDNGKPFDMIFPLRGSDGIFRPFLTRIMPVFDHDSRIIRWFGTNTDITDQKNSEDTLLKKNEDLYAAYEKIASTQKDLQQNIIILHKRERELYDALAEKEILLSEIHHRVKNNLAAFISLLSLEGTHEISAAGTALKKDLQNRARSMALIHETLYKTHKYSEVDMEVYLSTLIDQVVNSYQSAQSVRIVVEANGVALDLARATPTGLIVNELITNSIKYAFPPDFDCMEARGEPCTIHVSLVCEDGKHLLIVSDNGCGLPAGLDPLATKSLGLKLVKFLASHQLRAEIVVRTDKGTKFIFRLNKRED